MSNLVIQIAMGGIYPHVRRQAERLRSLLQLLDFLLANKAPAYDYDLFGKQVLSGQS